jgi:membrane associated rhomboid family serine protease
MLLIPVKHENMEGRRWPVVTFALIALNIIAFLGTHWTMESQGPEITDVRVHLLLLAAMHPELKMPDDVQQFVTDFQTASPEAWKQAGFQHRQSYDATDARTRQIDDPDELQAEMDSLSQRFHDIQEQSILLNYGFIPAHKRAITYITSIFLHGGWLHLIGNMWLLWLAGFILEENWGRIIYPVFYLLAGVAATQFHAWMYPNSILACLGASGAVAALMGAFLVRFPKLKIHMWAFAFIYRFRFKIRAYWLLPLWLLTEIFYGTLYGQASGVAHWAHVGGFIFGGLAALVIQRTGLEHKANAAIEAKVSWTADPGIVQATEHMEQGKLDEAIASLNSYLATKPDSLEACNLLSQIYWRKNDIPGYHTSIAKLCQLHLKAQDSEAAWQVFEDYSNTGGCQMPASTWLELCRLAEGKEHYERAVTEYEKLATAHPTERQSLLALMAAGRLSLKKLNQPAEALRLYQAASRSSVPHADWVSNIQAGLREAEKALAGTQLPALKP